MDENKKEEIELDVPQELYDQLLEISEKENKTIDEVVEELLKEYIKYLEKEKNNDK